MKHPIETETPIDEEYVNVLSNFDDWVIACREYKEKTSNRHDGYTNDKILIGPELGRLEEMCRSVDIYMTEPVAKYNTTLIEAKSRMGASVDDVISNLDPTKIALYMIHELITGDYKGHFRIRYAELGDDI